MNEEEIDIFRDRLRDLIYPKVKENQEAFDKIYTLLTIEFLTLFSLLPSKDRNAEKDSVITCLNRINEEIFEDWDDFKETVFKYKSDGVSDDNQ
jgi:hypothetical protein